MRRLQKGSNDMITLSWKPILSNLSEAYGELKNLYCRLHFMAFGEMPDNWKDDGSYKAWLEKREKEHPFTEMTLYVSLDHAYHHLNWAWNIRRIQEERILKCDEKDFKIWSNFPKTMLFAGLWPSKDVMKGCDKKVGCRKVSITPVRVHLLTAQQKLGILCKLVAKEIEGNLSQGNSQVDLNADNSMPPLTEKEFSHRMYRIFEELNMAWNSRKDKTFVRKFHAMQNRRYFSPIFLLGILVGWH